MAVAAAITRALAAHPWPEDAPVRVRIGLHAGTPQLIAAHYVGLDVHRAALAWAREQGMVEAGLRLAAGIWRFWWVRGYLGEGRDWLSALLANAERSTHHVSPRVYARALCAAGWFAAWQSEFEAAGAWLDQGLKLAHQTGDLGTAASILHSLAVVASHHRDRERAEYLYTESLRAARQAGDRWAAARAHGNLGFNAYFRGDPDMASTFLAEPLAFSREVGSREIMGTQLAIAGCIARRKGKLAEARTLLQESLQLHWEMHNKHRMAESLEMLAATLGAIGEAQKCIPSAGSRRTARHDLRFTARFLAR